MNNQKPILLFDGECNLCNGSVQFVIQRDKKGKVKFCSIQSEIGEKLMLEHQIPKNYLASIILIENNKIYYKSTAALRLSKYMNALWPGLLAFIIVPPFIRNWVYDFIAKNRYKWFGKTETCWIMTPELKDRFLN